MASLSPASFAEVLMLRLANAPARSSTMVIGPSGTGKTTLGLQFLAQSSAEEKGLFFLLERNLWLDRLLGLPDNERSALVCVLGEGAKVNLLGYDPAIGKFVKEPFDEEARKNMFGQRAKEMAGRK